MIGARDKLIGLMRALVANEITPAQLSEQYEPTWNFELEAAELKEGEAAVFERVFDVISWYTPVVEDRASYPGFKDERDVLEAVSAALEDLGEC
jgi:hypothetical protein